MTFVITMADMKLSREEVERVHRAYAGGNARVSMRETQVRKAVTHVLDWFDKEFNASPSGERRTAYMLVGQDLRKALADVIDPLPG